MRFSIKSCVTDAWLGIRHMESTGLWGCAVLSHSVMLDSLRPHGLSSVHWILQARLLQWVAMSSSEGVPSTFCQGCLFLIIKKRIFWWVVTEDLSLSDPFELCSWLGSQIKSFLPFEKKESFTISCTEHKLRGFALGFGVLFHPAIMSCHLCDLYSSESRVLEGHY